MTKKQTTSYQSYIDTVPVNIEAIIRSFDIELDKNSNLPQEVLGEISKKEGGQYKISIKKTDHYYRKRFTMAHELGHFILHKDKIGDGIDDSENYRPVRRTGTSAGEEEEREANNFAANILMPKDLVLKYARERGVFNNGVIDDDALKEISTAFQVSPAAMKITITRLKPELVQN
jgi:Zn-dependent peptidase ImmA (M78 family)